MRCTPFVRLLYYIFILHQTTTINAKYFSPLLLYYIFILHQTTTKKLVTITKGKLYYIFILHQTTTATLPVPQPRCCIISSFYIKPQLNCNTSKQLEVVLYLHSTSNHNLVANLNYLTLLYYIFILHQTTTYGFICFIRQKLYYIFILHQTTTKTNRSPFGPWLYYIFILHQTTTEVCNS